MRIVFLDRSTIGPAVTLTKPGFEHEWVDHDRTHPDEVVERLQGADIAVSNKVPIGRAQIEALPDLKMIAIPATGYDRFDLDACRERGIVVSNVRGYATNTVPEHTFALILALRRGIIGFRQDVIDGKWQEADQFCVFTHPINDLAESTNVADANPDVVQSLRRKLMDCVSRGRSIIWCGPRSTGFAYRYSVL